MRAWPGRSSRIERRSSCLVALCGLLALAWCSTVAAAPGTVLLLRVDDDEAAQRWRAAESRTRDELRVMGLEVIELPAADPDRREGEVEHLMAERGATAAIRLERGPESGDARIWLRGPPAGRLRRSQVALALDGGEAAIVAALRTVEVVHAGLLASAAAELPPPAALATAAAVETTLLPPAPPEAYVPIVVTRPGPGVVAPEVPAPRIVRVGDRRPPRRISGRHALGVHATVGGGPGGLGVLTGLEVAYRRELPRLVGFELDLLGVSTPGWRSQGEGSIVMGLAGARALVVVQPRQQRVVTPRLGLGGGAAVVWAIGRAPEPLRGVRDVAGVAVLSGSVSLAVRVRPRLRLVFGAGLDLLLPPIVVRIAGAETSRVGLPTLRGSLGVEWFWPAGRPRPR